MVNDLKLWVTKLVKENKQGNVDKIVQNFIFSETIKSFREFENKLYSEKIKVFTKVLKLKKKIPKFHPTRELNVV